MNDDELRLRVVALEENLKATWAALATLALAALVFGGGWVCYHAGYHSGQLSGYHDGWVDRSKQAVSP